jgi:S-formylglutathione hydrolase FrmB
MTQRMERSLLLIFIVAVFALPLPLVAQSRIDCDAIKSRILQTEVHYCVYLPASYDHGSAEHPRQSYPLLYYLHGLGDNERSLFNSGGFTVLDDLHRQGKIGEFLIAAPEGGHTFYINSADGKVRYSDFFLQEFVPFIESKYRVAKGREHRAITGISMGGYGALRFAFAYPEMFSAVSAQSAALMTESPRELDLAMQSGYPLAKLIAAVFGDPINVDHWNRNNPFVLAKQNRVEIKRLAIYFNCGRNDNYGFEKGAGAMDAELDKEEIRHDYHLYPGDHSFSYFISHFPEVMEFHSRAFGVK